MIFILSPKIQELERRALEQIGAIEGMSEETAETLFRLGWRSVAELSRALPEELGQVPGIDGPEAAAAIVEGAKSFLKQDTRRKEQARREAERRAGLTDEEKLLEVEGIDETLVEKLANAGCHSVEALAHVENLEQVAGGVGLDAEQVRQLRHDAGIWLGEIPKGTPLPVADSESFPEEVRQEG